MRLPNPVSADTAYHLERLEALPEKPRPAFSRGRTLVWLCVLVVGMVCGRDARGG